MTYKLNPFTGKLDTSDGPQGPAGVVSAAGPGSQGTPSISFAADLDTGLYNYTANGIAVSTGGTGRLFIDSSGRVGIGTTSPSQKLDISTGYLNFTDNYGIRWGGVTSTALYANSTDNFIGFQTSGGEAARIDSSGRLGVGTTSPSEKLTIGDPSATPAITIGRTPFSTYGNLLIHGSANTITSQTDSDGNSTVNVGASRVTVSNGSIAFSRSATTAAGSARTFTESARITSDGKLGLGTSSPQNLFSLGLPTATTSRILGQYGNNEAPTLEVGVGQSSTFRGGMRIAVTDTGAGSVGDSVVSFHTTKDGGGTVQRLTIDQDGNVGIGTTSAALKLHAEDSSSQIVRWTRTGVGAGSLDVDASGNAVLNAHTNSTGIAFHLQASEKARIDSSGRLLVGTVSTIGNVRAVFSGWGAQPTQQGIVRVQRGSLPTSGQTIADIEFADDSNNLGGNVTAVADANWTSGTSHPSRLVFSTTAAGASSPTERMRISSNGDVNVPGTFYAKYNAVFTWNTSAGIKAVGDGNTNTGGVGIETTTASTATRYHVSISNPNGVVGSISTNGSATAYNTSSDYRLKENVVPLTGAADRVNQLQVHRFNFIADPGKTVDGFIAHEAQAVVPEAVTGTHNEVDDDGNPVYQGIDQSKLVPLLTAALQEALAEIESLKARVTALEP